MFKLFFIIYIYHVLIFYSFPQNSVEFAVLGATSNVVAMLPTYPFHVQLSHPLSFEAEKFGLLSLNIIHQS
jgi:TRAP-type mannitol/chloroaromatic compound transport system permease small subunit